jgi:hypothetical protein
VAERRSAPHLSPWGRLVIVCAAVVGGCAVALAIGALVSRTEREVTGVIRGSLSGVSLDLGDASVEIIRGGNRESVEVRRTERFTFDHGPEVQRRISGSTLSLTSRCPDTLLHPCAAAYRLIVPDNVPVKIRTDSGDVRFEGYRGSVEVSTDSGDVTITGYCGFSLDVRSRTGDIDSSASCAPQALTLRSTSSPIRSIVPPGRYRVDVESTSGRRVVRGVIAADDAPYTIQVLSTSGDVTLESTEQ